MKIRLSRRATRRLEMGELQITSNKMLVSVGLRALDVTTVQGDVGTTVGESVGETEVESGTC